MKLKFNDAPKLKVKSTGKTYFETKTVSVGHSIAQRVIKLLYQVRVINERRFPNVTLHGDELIAEAFENRKSMSLFSLGERSHVS